MVAGYFVYIFIIFSPQNKEIIVKDLKWERITSVCEKQLVTHEGWEFPEGARLISAEKKVYERTRKMFQYGWTSHYADWYKYETNDTVKVKTLIKTGNKEDAIEWPTTQLLEGQFYSNESETYSVVDTEGNIYKTTFEVWNQLKVNKKIKVTINSDKTLSLT